MLGSRGAVREGGPLARPSDERETTPIYQRPARVLKEVTVRAGSPRLARDKVLHLLRDGRYHSAYEISNVPTLAAGEWYVALQQLVEYGYDFARKGNSLLLLLEKKATKTPAEDLARLLSGIDASKPDVPTWEHQHRAKQDDDRFVERLGPDGQVSTIDDGGPSFLDPVLSDGDSLRISTDETRLSARASITSTRAILARKSSGKTYLGMVIAEEYLRIAAKGRVPMPFVAIDPTGVWYGLCSDDEGKPSSHAILRLGGTHGTWPLDPKQGAAVAELVVSLWPLPVVLDVSDMLPEEQHEFVADFGNKLYTINNKPIHIFIDEADEYCPQRIESGNKSQQRCLGVLDRMVRRGRVKGIGTTLITQRPAVLNKNALSQVDGIFILSLSAPHDLEAIETWMRPAASSSDRNLCLQALPTLERGEVFFVQANLKAGSLIKFTTREKTTFDSSKTPTVDDPTPDVALLSEVTPLVRARAGAALGDSGSVAWLRDWDERQREAARLKKEAAEKGVPITEWRSDDDARPSSTPIADWKPEASSKDEPPAPEAEDEAYQQGSNDMGGSSENEGDERFFPDEESGD